MPLRQVITPTYVLALMVLTFAINTTAHAETLPATADPRLEFAFEEIVTLGPDQPVGVTAMGGRNIIPITGGTFEGPSFKGTVMPGGWDWQLRRADGCLSLKADYMLRTDDGVIINVVNQGVSCPAVNGHRDPVRTLPVFEAPLGAYDWLGKSTFVGTLEPIQVKGQRAVRIRFFRVK